MASEHEVVMSPIEKQLVEWAQEKDYPVLDREWRSQERRAVRDIWIPTGFVRYDLPFMRNLESEIDLSKSLNSDEQYSEYIEWWCGPFLNDWSYDSCVCDERLLNASLNGKCSFSSSGKGFIRPNGIYLAENDKDDPLLKSLRTIYRQTGRSSPIVFFGKPFREGVENFIPSVGSNAGDLRSMLKLLDKIIEIYQKEGGYGFGAF